MKAVRQSPWVLSRTCTPRRHQGSFADILHRLPQYKQELLVAVEAVRRAGVLTEGVGRQGAETFSKEDHSPVTVADMGSQALLCNTITARFPDDDIMGEEDSTTLRTSETLLRQVLKAVQRVRPRTSARDIGFMIDAASQRAYTPRFWAVDPIDGTKGYIRGEQYAICLALVEDGVPVVAALNCPRLQVGDATGVVVAATRGGGAFALSGQDVKQMDLSVRDLTDISQAVVTESVEGTHQDHAGTVRIKEHLGITANEFRIDSQAKYAAVGMGMADLYLRIPTIQGRAEQLWDHAAGALLAEEAGGKVTDLEGKPIDWSRGYLLLENRGLVVATPSVHERVLAAVKELGL